MDSELNKTDKTFKVLVVDDDRQILKVLYNYLTNENYDVVTASDGLEGMKLLETEKQGFDLVITDLVMPKISGSYLILEIRKRFPGTPVIAITGWEAYPDGFIIETQADKVFEKPFILPELNKSMQELLSLKKKD
ncbi:MAG: response regulator [Desulfobacterales bacterium]|uniref:Response regulator n=1 Tax=Candidatus Desulfatibia vada TaxID=2841696 RepID=A0A8J6NWY3_9BACT|nr:response regulator [Candidatus Desulfatibia vada]